MNTYVTGATIKTLRESRSLTQAELAEAIGVSSKTVSKWETAKGLPDISLLQPLAQALGITETRLQLRGRGWLYYYCNRHGLFRKKGIKIPERKFRDSVFRCRNAGTRRS